MTAIDVTHTAEYKIRDLGTRSVTLFPSRAQIVREIKDVALKVSPACLIDHGPLIDMIMHEARCQ